MQDRPTTQKQIARRLKRQAKNAQKRTFKKWLWIVFIAVIIGAIFFIVYKINAPRLSRLDAQSCAVIGYQPDCKTLLEAR